MNERMSIVGYFILSEDRSGIVVEEFITSEKKALLPFCDFIEQLTKRRGKQSTKIYSDETSLLLLRRGYCLRRQPFFTVLKPFIFFFNKLSVPGCRIEIHDSFLKKSITVGNDPSLTIICEAADIIDYLWGNISILKAVRKFTFQRSKTIRLLATLRRMRKAFEINPVFVSKLEQY